jgi:predicted metal-dependent hydrolase
MNYVDPVKQILEEYKKKLGINEDVKVKIRRYKTKSAFINLKTKTIYINESLLDLGEEVIRYLILHELIHLKLNSKYHIAEFNKTLYAFITPEKASEIRGMISNKLLSTMCNNMVLPCHSKVSSPRNVLKELHG